MTSNQQATNNNSNEIVNGQMNQATEKLSLTNESTTNSDLKCELKWSIRELLISNLNSHTSYLYGKTITIDQKAKQLKENGDLLQILLNLPVKLIDDKSNEIESIRNVNENLTNKQHVYEPILIVDWQTKMKIVDSCFSNHAVALNNYGDLIKNDLIVKNKQLIEVLMNLPVFLTKSELVCGNQNDKEMRNSNLSEGI